MARWEPNAAQRLVAAALDLFAEQGYENTTVIEIAERAGLTKSTFFRHFPDKREVLFGGTTMNELLAGAIAAAPADASPLEAVAQAMGTLGATAFTAERRERVALRRAVIEANPGLLEREALKGLGLIASTIDALKARGVPDLAARVAAEFGALTMKIAYERWTEAAVAGGDGTVGDGAVSDGAVSDGAVSDGAVSDGAVDDGGADFGEIARHALDEVVAACASAATSTTTASAAARTRP